MHFLLLSIVLSVSVSVLLKLAPRLKLDIRQAIFVNYMVAALLAAWFLSPNPVSLVRDSLTVWGLLIVLGLGLPFMFWILALSVRSTGVVRTDAAMRLSLLLPLIAAFTWFGEALTPLRIIGVVLGLVAIALIVMRRSRHSLHVGARGILLLLTVFVGMGVIDILFKIMARLSSASSTSVLLAAFSLAALASLLAMAWLYSRRKARWKLRHLLAGLVLGALNFGNIVFYIQAHRAVPQNPALVFAAMNIGVIVLSVLVGVLAFREPLSRSNSLGLLLAVLAVVVLAWA